MTEKVTGERDVTFRVVRFPMKNYPGVFCFRCGAPIPVPAKVVSLRDEIVKGEPNAPYSFVDRCKVCCYETVYEIKDVRRFGGEPPKRKPLAEAA